MLQDASGMRLQFLLIGHVNVRLDQSYVSYTNRIWENNKNSTEKYTEGQNLCNFCVQ